MGGKQGSNGSVEAKMNKLTSSHAATTLGPSVLAAAVMLGLVFGGCCSNVTVIPSTVAPTWADTFSLGICIRINHQVSILDMLLNTKTLTDLAAMRPPVVGVRIPPHISAHFSG